MLVSAMDSFVKIINREKFNHGIEKILGNKEGTQVPPNREQLKYLITILSQIQGGV